MPTLVLIGSVLVLVLVAAVVFTRRRAAPAVAPGAPRTVADLVALRAEQSAARGDTPARGVAARSSTPRDTTPRDMTDPYLVVRHLNGRSPTDWESAAWQRPVDAEVAGSADLGGTHAPPRIDAREVGTVRDGGDGMSEEVTAGAWSRLNDLPTPPAGVPVVEPFDVAGVGGNAPWDRAALMRLKQRGPRSAGVIAAALLPADTDTPSATAQAASRPAAVESPAVGPAGVESLPVESLPVESLPAEALPVEALPVESLPVKPGPATAGPFAPRPRRSDEDTAAERAAADRGLNRTFGVPDGRAPLVSAGPVPVAEATPGASRAIRFRTATRDGSAVPGATVTLLDHRGVEIAKGVADEDGRGELRAPGPGGFVVVSAAPGHQPGAVAVTVAGSVLDTDILLVRSAALSGSVFGEDGPILGAELTLLQDGEVVEVVDTAADGSYRMADLAAGDYELAVTADGCAPSSTPIEIPDAADLHHDVDLDPAGLPGDDGLPHDDLLDDVMIGQR